MAEFDPEVAKEIMKYIPEDVIKKLAERPAEEAGSIITNAFKTLHLFLLPIQVGAAFQDRLKVHLDRVVRRVPERNRVQAPPHIAGPILENLRYLEEGNILAELYLNLLTRSIDGERQNEAHPAFINIIESLSPDEAMMVFLLHREPFAIWGGNFVMRLQAPRLYKMYLSHLESLNIIKTPVALASRGPESLFERIDRAIHDPTHEFWIRSQKSQQSALAGINLTEFGQAFADVCIPLDWEPWDNDSEKGVCQ